ncbi:hypothetical protein [Anatilimnocola floriformis]|uniref:hypothetical protein n=1 Tax=Anatilimnocola floriformis TaxID=2948575 RepID=UPI0020C1BEE9|nr:hypothetical protein [Anatilimnocola floriformis]
MADPRHVKFPVFVIVSENILPRMVLQNPNRKCFPIFSSKTTLDMYANERPELPSPPPWNEIDKPALVKLLTFIKAANAAEAVALDPVFRSDPPMPAEPMDIDDFLRHIAVGTG